MPKQAINRTEINKVQKLLRAGHMPEEIARHLNIEVGVVEAFDPENEAKVKEAIRKAENVASMEDAILKEEAQAAERKRRQAAVKRARKKVDDEAEAG